MIFPSFPLNTRMQVISCRISRVVLPHLLAKYSHKSLSSPQTDGSDFDTSTISNLLRPDLPISLHLLSQAKSKFSTQDEAFSFLRSSPIEKDLIFPLLWELRREWESALLAFRWAGDAALESPSAGELMVWVLGRERRFDLAWMILRRMHRKSVMTSRALVIMMERYASANEAGKAIKTFDALEKFNVKPDLVAFYALLRALCKNKNIEEAEELLLLKQKFFPLETAGFNIILDGWCNILVDLIEAKRVWREMAKYCITPDSTSYIHMIGCFAKHGNLFDSLRLYNGMKKRGWIPNLKVYNCLIYVLTRENCLKEAHSIFNKIMEAGLQPDLDTYNCMILPLCEEHKLDEAQEIMKMMISGGLRPSLDTYHAFVKVEDFGGILKRIEQMKEDGNAPNRSTFLLSFNNLLRLGEPESALKMWSEMKKYDVIPDIVHYTTMIKGFAAVGWIPKATEFYGEMKSKGFPADPELEQLFNGFLSKKKNLWRGGGKGCITRKYRRNRITKDLKL